MNGEAGESSSTTEIRTNGTAVAPVTNSTTGENGGGARPRTRSNDVEAAPIPAVAAAPSRTPNGTPQQTPSRIPNGTAAVAAATQASRTETAPATPAPSAGPAGPEEPLPPG